MNRLHGIYKIENTLTRDVYIGQSLGVAERLEGHLRALEHDRHGNRHLQKAYDKYGYENFIFEPILYCESDELTYYEQELVNINKGHLYNIREECVESNRGIKFSNEARKHISQSGKGRKLSEEHKKNISKGGKGKLRSKEARQHISAGRKGVHPSEEARLRLKGIHKGQVCFWKGKTLSIETRMKISKSHKGKPPWNKGGHASDETKAKMSKNRKGVPQKERRERNASK